MIRQIIIKPVITEKSERLSKDRNQYTFKVDRNSNKVEIKKAIESTYSVSVIDVNTSVIPGKAKVRNTKAGMVKGIRPAYKKAMVTLKKGDEINIFGDYKN